MKTNNVRLAEFEIETDLGSVRTNELYANGRHQCKVYIRVAKQVEDASGLWQIVALTPAEKASATLKEYSTNPNAGLPPGWSCDTQKNLYDSGLWRQDNEPEDELQDDTHPRAGGAPVELLERYMRFAANQPIQAKRFMASITIGGKVYTTNYSDDDSAFNSYVEISPIAPYVLRVAQLQRYIDAVGYYNEPDRLRVSVYYWQPPANLYFVESLGLTAPLSVPDEGTHFQTAFCRVGTKGGVAVGKNVLGTTLFLSQVKRNIYADKDPEIEFNLQPTPMRAVVLDYGGGFAFGDSNGTWGVIDNFGCEHRYRLVWGDFDVPAKLTD